MSLDAKRLLTESLKPKEVNNVTREIVRVILEATHSSRRRLASYLIPSMLASILLNLPKFLEARLENLTYVHNNVTRSNLVINVTSLRINPDYSYYYIGWTRYKY